MRIHADVVGAEKEWFYSDVVKEHFFRPKNTFRTKKEAEKYRADGVGIVGSPACLPADSKIYTNLDIKNIESIDSSFEVLSRDGKYNKVLKPFSRNYSGNLISAYLSYLILSSTA